MRRTNLEGRIRRLEAIGGTTEFPGDYGAFASICAKIEAAIAASPHLVREMTDVEHREALKQLREEIERRAYGH